MLKFNRNDLLQKYTLIINDTKRLILFNLTNREIYFLDGLFYE